MYTLRHSEPRTVLLWGNRWWLPGQESPREFGNLGEAVAVLVAAFAEEPKPVRIRLIYQPDHLETCPVACPQGNRATIAAALAGEFPALGDPAFAWGYEPVLPGEGGASTLLHVEREPVLPELARNLALRGLAVTSAWPLAAYLPAVPLAWTASGAVTVVAVETERAVAYRHPSDGQRGVQTWRGEATLADVGAWLRQLLEQDADEPILVVVPDHTCAIRLETFVGGDLGPKLEVLRMGEALGRPVPLARYHPAQLLPRPPFVTAERAVIAAGSALMLTAAVAGLGQGWQALRLHEAAAEQAREVVQLRSEVDHLREVAREIADLRREIAGSAGGAPNLELLTRIGRTIPAELVLSKLHVAGRAIALEGWAAPEGVAAVEAWGRQLGQDAPWEITAQTLPEGTFRLTGGFRP